MAWAAKSHPLVWDRNEVRLPADMIAEPRTKAVRRPITSPSVPAESTRLATTSAKTLGIQTMVALSAARSDWIDGTEEMVAVMLRNVSIMPKHTAARAIQRDRSVCTGGAAG